MLSDRCLSCPVCLVCAVGVLWQNLAGWIKMTLGMKVGLGPCRIVLDGDSTAPPPKKKGGTAPNFRPVSVVAKRQTLTVFQHPSTAESTL